jgi:hypothetical protein
MGLLQAFFRVRSSSILDLNLMVIDIPGFSAESAINAFKIHRLFLFSEIALTNELKTSD